LCCAGDRGERVIESIAMTLALHLEHF